MMRDTLLRRSAGGCFVRIPLQRACEGFLSTVVSSRLNFGSDHSEKRQNLVKKNGCAFLIDGKVLHAIARLNRKCRQWWEPRIH